VQLRRSERRPTSVKPDVLIQKKKSTAKADVTKEKKSEPAWDDSREKLVSVGRLFQAEVPQWTGVVYESDSKWLGT